MKVIYFNTVWKVNINFVLIAFEDKKKSLNWKKMQILIQSILIKVFLLKYDIKIKKLY